MTLGIQAIAHAFGSTKLDNLDYAARYGFESAFIREKLGIATRYVAGEAESSSDLAVAATSALLKKTAVDPATIGLILVVTQTPDYQLPHTAALVQDRLGFPLKAASFDVSLGCSGFVYGLSLATSFMAGNGIRRAILIAVDCYSKMIDPADRATAPLFSDAASATLLSDQPVYVPGQAVFGSDGSGASSLIVEQGGSRHPGTRGKLFMDGRAIYSFMMSRIPQDVADCLALNRLAAKDIDRFVFHQANRFMLESLCGRLKLPPEKVVIDVNDCGNTVGSSIPIALEPLLNEPPARILISGFGVGLSWATNVLQLGGE
jgi:3-oxoacyl-[acyl-carrier-protein] synthase-3